MASPADVSNEDRFMEEIDLEDVPVALSGLINSVRILDRRVAARAMTGAQIVAEFAEMFPPAVLFSESVLSMPAIYKAIRDWLIDHGANLPQHTSRRVMLQLATTIYSENEDTQAAEAIVKGIINAGRRTSRGAAAGPAVADRTADRPAHGDGLGGQDKLAYYIGMRFREKDSKFSGDLGESWMEYVAEYQQVARDYALTPAQKKQYLHNLLRGDAKRYYLDRVDSDVNNFAEAIRRIDNEYNSIVRQNRVKNHLAGLRLSRYTAEGLDELASLEKVYKLITKLSPQVPISHRGEAHKIEFLRNATVGYAWATEPLSRVATHGLTFQQIYGELEAALHLAREANLANIRDKASVRYQTPRTDDENVPGILFQGPGRYARRHKGVGDTSRPGLQRRTPSSGYPRFDPLSVMGCFNCDDPGHMVKACPKQVDLSKAATRKMEYLTKKTGKSRNAHLVLFELCQQLEGAELTTEVDVALSDELQVHVAEAEAEDDEDPDFDLFDALVNYVEHAPSSIDGETTTIYLTSRMTKNHVFNGACLDTGAQRSVIGKAQAEAYYRFMGIPLAIIAETPKLYKFGSERKESIGKAKFRIPYAQDRHMLVELDVVDVDIPLLLGLDVLDKYKLVVDTVDNRLLCRNPVWSAPLVRKLGHVYYEWHYEIMYTEAELRKIHRHFYHPTPDRIHSLLKRANDTKTTPSTLADLEKITRSCDVCQRTSTQPGRFRVSLPNDDVVFNRLVLMDLMSLESTSVLHMVCKDTLFSSAVFLTGETANDVWVAYLRFWVNPYIGYSKAIHVDRGPQFDSDRWRHLLQSAGIERFDSGIESHNALGAGEKYHDFLRRIYRKVRIEHPKVAREDCLSLAVHAMNNTAGPNGLAPTLLVFGVVPSLPLGLSDLPEQRARMKMLNRARSEMTKAIAASRIRTALSRNVPAAADREVRIGSQVLFYREKGKGWEGPYRVIAGDGKNLWININDDLKRVSVDKVKEYICPSIPLASESVPNTGDDFTEDHRRSIDSVFDRLISGDTFLTQVQDRMARLRSSTEGDSKVIETPSPIFLMQRVPHSDPRASSDTFEAAKRNEVKGLKSRKVWKVVNRSDLPASANIIGARFDLTLKNAGTDREKAKARFVGQGFRDEMKDFIVHNTPTLRQSSTKTILSISAVLNYRVSMVDFIQAYLQAKEKLNRKIYLKVREADRYLFEIGDDELLQLEKPLYGICDSGDYWGATFGSFVKNELNMVPLDGDPSLYSLPGHDCTVGLLGAYVDDNIFAGSEEFDTIINRTSQAFESKPVEHDNFEFVGLRIETDENGLGIRSFCAYQPEYLLKLRELPKDATFAMFSSARAAFGWISHSRPDICCAVNRAAQVTEDSFTSKSLSELNESISYAKNTADIRLVYRALNREALHIRAYADASFASNYDLTSQLGFIIFLCDDEDRCHVLNYSSRKSRRVVRSIMAGEVYAFSAAFDVAYVLKHDLERLLCQSVPLKMFTDSKQLFDVITRASHTTEKRLMIDVAAAREAYNSFEISNVGLVAGTDNPADGLTKPKFCKSLFDILSTGVDSTPVVQWIIRKQ